MDEITIWENLSPEEKKRELFLRQKRTLDLFLEKNAISKSQYDKSLGDLKEKMNIATTHEEFLDIAENHPGFIKAMWCGDRACEELLKEKAGVSSRCMPFEQESLTDKCVCCGKPAKKMVYWGKAY